jgi:hypothetical protein
MVSIIEATVAVISLIVTLLVLLIGWLRGRERMIHDKINELEEDIDELKASKISRDEMKEYVELSNKYLVNSIEHLLEEQKTTRRLLEKIYYATKD